jgi:hypothetical protein
MAFFHPRTFLVGLVGLKFLNWIRAADLKLGVATLLRVAQCPKRVAKFDKKKRLAINTAKKPKMSGLAWYFLHLEGRKIFLTC